MNIILGILTFAIVLFIYLHIFYHLKTSNDLEVYELSQGADSKIDDEVYINISNPQITYLRYTDGSKGGNIFDGEGNKRKNKDFEESKEPPFEWKWYHTTGLILLGTAVFVGILLWRRSSPKVAVVENVQPQRVVMQR